MKRVRMLSKRAASIRAGFTLILALAGCGDDVKLVESEAPAATYQNATLVQQLESLQGVQVRPQVPVIRLRAGSIQEELSITGELVPQHSVLVKPLMDGQLILMRTLKVGDRVGEGELLAKIDDRDIEDEIERQQQQIQISQEKLALDETSLEQARKDLDFDRQLLKEGFLNQSAFAKSEMAVREAEISLRQSRIQLEQEENRLKKVLRQRERVPIVAPISGMLVPASHLEGSQQGRELLQEDLMALEGTLVGSATALFGIISDQGFLAQCLVNGKDKAKLAEGQAARVTVITHRPIEVAGLIQKISLLQDPQSHAYKIWLALEKNDSAFTSGLFVRADVVLARHEGALTLSKKYLKQINGQPGVQVVRNDKVVNIAVDEGLDNGQRVELLGGVTAGDLVVASEELFAADQLVQPVELESDVPMRRVRLAAPAEALPLDFFNTSVGKSQAVTLQLEDEPTSGTVASLELMLEDLDEVREVEIFVNGQGPLNPPENLVRQNQERGKTELPGAWLKLGSNELRFVFASDLEGSTGGFRVLEVAMEAEIPQDE